MGKENKNRADELTDEEAAKVAGSNGEGALVHHCLNWQCNREFPVELTVCPTCGMSMYETVSLLPGCNLPRPDDF